MCTEEESRRLRKVRQALSESQTLDRLAGHGESATEPEKKISLQRKTRDQCCLPTRTAQAKYILERADGGFLGCTSVPL